MAHIKVELESVKELQEKLSKLSNTVRNQIAKDAVDEGGSVIQDKAQLNARDVFSENQHGQLRDSIRVESRPTATGAEAEIGPHVIYGRIQELGGEIVPVHASSLHFVIDGQDIFAKHVKIPPRPYLGPAVTEHINEITKAMSDAIRDGINDAV